MSATKSPLPSDGCCITPSISKLPTELITYIIVLSLPNTYPGDKRLKALYSLRMVSRMWRDVVDSTPSLWNIISDWVPAHVNSTSIQRSGSFPLDVFIKNHTLRSRLAKKQDPIKLIELAAREIGRWSTVWLWLPSSDVCSLYLASPAPLLRELHVISGSWSDRTTPVALFGGVAPRLESLEVDRVPVDWKSPFIHGLRELDLSDMIDGQISTQQALDILASASLLKRLTICTSFLDPHIQPFGIGPASIRLPNLSTIHFEGTNLKAVEIILSSIRAPNCHSLILLEGEDNDVDPSNFLQQGLGHFTDFLRQTLSTNKQSYINCLDESMQWESRSWPKGPNSLEFLLNVRCGAPATGVRWATGIIGLGAQEVQHDLELSLAHGRFDEGDLAAYRSLGRCQSVARLGLSDDYAPAGAILELLGTWQEQADGIDSLPTFPNLKDFSLAESEDWTLDDLEVLVNRRFGEPGDVTITLIPNLSIDIRIAWYYEYPQNSKPDLGQLLRLRSAHGVESLTRTISKHQPGMVAVVYEGDT